MADNHNAYSVKINGKEVKKLAPISYIEINNRINSVPYAIIKILEWLKVNPKEELLINNDIFTVGSTVEIQAGDAKSKTPIFNGIVAKISLKMNSELEDCYVEVIAKDKSHQLTIAHNSTTYKDKTDDSIIKELITQQGLSADVGDMAMKHESFAICNTSDWDFINLRAEAYGMVVVCDNGKVIIKQPKNESGSVIAIWGKDIIEMNLELDSDNQIEKTEGKIWDIKTQTVKVVNTTASESSFGSCQYSDLTKTTGKPHIEYTHDGILEDTELKTFISGILSLNRFAKIHGFIVINGQNIKPNTSVKIDKCANIFNGNAYVSGVKHIITGDGDWSTKLYIGLSGKRYVQQYNDIFLPDNYGMIPPITSLRIGTVTKIDGDPQNIYRVFVNLPTLHQSGDGIWCRLSTFYATQSAGCLFFPEINDEVVVGFLSADPRYPVVLGSLYNPKNKPAIPNIEATNKVKSIITKNKLEISLQDEDKVITVSTPGKRLVTISDKDESIIIDDCGDKISIVKGAITIKCSKDISIEGNNINIKASGKISLNATSDMAVSGNNVNIKASMAANIEGSMSAGLKSSGTTAVKGTLVNIN